MQLSKQMQQVLTEEIGFAVGKMKGSQDAATKLYFFSAVPAAANRIMNIEFDSELSFIHYVLSAAYGTVSARLAMLASGQERGMGIPEKLFDRLEEALMQMVVEIHRGESTHQVLETISNLAYSATGNGYYLYLKGVLPI